MPDDNMGARDPSSKTPKNHAAPRGLGSGITQLVGDVTAGPGSGLQAATIATHAVTNTKLAQMGADTLKGNNASLAGNAADLSARQPC
jgi:hypothetical protein